MGTKLGIKDELGTEEGITEGIPDGTKEGITEGIPDGKEDFDGLEPGKHSYEG